ncbi:exopolyphosphatase [Desulfonema ishimotonii]|uniref:Exopolyphosphatase n=1 Tax=Desulfonema ishimotonii TaxID=45657 RepID=A0A401FVY2_9BACT|nr:exopolyphosphatase [Desulfonema ishimotonii]GBC61126.1 exopolyphosphatase [Desulfonema ishimotonii]
MRIVTRPDFDGIVCAALLYETEKISEPVHWVEPNDMQKGRVEVREGDIIANLPYNKNCAMWFDHHYTNRPDTPFEGSFAIAPSAAGLVFEYYKDKFQRDYTELIRETDRIDSADLTLDEVLRPEDYPYILLSMTISGRDHSDQRYWERLIQLLRNCDIDDILRDPEVRERCETVVEQNRAYQTALRQHTTCKQHVTITDFRSYKKTPRGNRFLIYSLFPEAVVSVSIRRDIHDREKIIVGLGHSIFNRNCHVNVGLLLSRFGGGGHRGAGSCTVREDRAESCIAEIVDTLMANQPNE